MPPAIHHTRPAEPRNGEGVGSTYRRPDIEGCRRLCVVAEDLDAGEHGQPGRPSLEERGCQRTREVAAVEVDAGERTRAGEFGGRGQRGSAGGRDAN